MKRILIITGFLIFCGFAFIIVARPTLFNEKQTQTALVSDTEDTGIRYFEQELILEEKFDFLEGMGVFAIFDHNGMLYIIDNGMEIYRSNLQGTEMKKLVSSGGAPYETENPINLSLTGTDTLSFADMGKKALISLNVNNSERLISFKKLRFNIYDGLYLGNQRYLLIKDDGRNSAILLYDNKNNKEVWSDKLSDAFEIIDTDYPEITTEGAFAKADDGTSYYVPGRMGQFISFDKSGNVRFKARTIDNTPSPKTYTKKVMAGLDALMFVREPDFYVNYSVTADNDHLYILSKYAGEVLKAGDEPRIEKYKTLDLYSSIDGVYKSSMKVPNLDGQKPIEITSLSKTMITILYENYTVATFKIKSKSDS